MARVPTILIGLGGLGSYIVDKVYGWIPEEERSFVAIHAFDTNVNDIAKLVNLKKENVTQTSTNWTVAEYLRMADESVKDWFPYEQTEIQRKSLTDGAGQVRAVSRLAYRAAMESGKLSGLHSSINHIFRETGAGTTSSARVMIVCSIVGGTGAGIFLQTAMYMRDLLEHDFHRKNVLIRGAFMLPDTLVLTNVIQGDEVENIRANAYASIKELNAITKNSSSQGADGNRVAIELEYKPNQVDAYGRLNHVIDYNNLPYNFCFLFDFENTEKNNLKYFTNYINQVARTTFLDLFSPMTNDRFSKQDNQILSTIENHGMNRYCGAGVSSLVYPYEDIIYYSSLRWSTDSLSNDWLKIDEQFERDFRQYELDLRNGIPREKPLLRDSYREVLYRLAHQQNPRPFFRLVYRAAHSIDKRNDVGSSKASLFVDALLRRIETVLAEDEKIREFKGECDLDENRLQDKGTARDEINNREESLYYYEQTIRKFIHNTKNYLVNEIVLQDSDHPQKVSGDDYKLNTWLLKQNEAIHPVSIRYVLYEIDALLEEKVKELTPKNDKLEKGIDRYKKAYDLDETDDLIETADDRMDKAVKQSWFQRLMNNEFKDFTNEYVDKSNKHFSNLNRFVQDRLTELVFKELQKAIVEMEKDWEKYFKNLRDVRNSLNNELNILANKHDNDSDPTIRYVLASKEIKEKLWETIRVNIGSDELPVEISEQIYKGQYERFCKRRKGDYLTEQHAEKIEEMFRKDVLGWCTRTLLKEDSLNLNAIRALRREGQIKGLFESDINQYIKDQIRVLNNLARPFVPHVNNVTELNAWGVHPDCVKELSGDARNDLFDDTDLVEHEAFSPYEITRNRTVYGLSIDSFDKFYSGDNSGGVPGEYYKAYNSRIRKLTQRGNTVTPHLDKRWHLPAYLPEIHSHRVQEDEDKINRALIWGVTLGYLQNINEFGRLTWLFNDDAGSRLIKEGDQLADKYIHSLHNALLYNPIVVDKVLKRTQEQFDADRADYRASITKHAFHSRAKEIDYFGATEEDAINIVDLILRYPEGNPGDPDLVKTSNDLLKNLLDEIVKHFIEVYGRHRDALAMEAAFAYIDELFIDSKFYQFYKEDKIKRNSSVFKAWENIVKSLKKQYSTR